MQVNLTVNIMDDFWEVVQWPLYTGLTVFQKFQFQYPKFSSTSVADHSKMFGGNLQMFFSDNFDKDSLQM